MRIVIVGIFIFSLCVGGCSPPPKSFVSISPENNKIVLKAQADLQGFANNLGPESAEFSEHFRYYALQLIELYRAENPGTDLLIDPMSTFGELILKYAPENVKKKCINKNYIDLDCLVRQMKGQL